MNKSYDRKLRGRHCQCQGCFEYFNSFAAFEKHRVGTFMPDTRHCLTTDEMYELGMSLNSADFWITSERPQNVGLAGTTSAATVVNGSEG